MANEKTPSVHAGHRDRVRERYLHSGMEDMQDHEVLELLLTYAIPRKDVNPTAHALIDRFGSISKVMDAPVEEIKEVDGMGDISATFLHMLPKVFHHYQLDKVKPCPTYETLPKVGAFVQALFVGETVEKLYLLLFDNGMHMLDCKLISEGTVNHVAADAQKIVLAAVHANASCVVLAHNHPRGLAIPSRDDTNMTNTVEAIMETINIPLIEHIIVSDHSFSATMRSLKGILRASSPDSGIDEEFYKRFYGITSDNNT